MELYMEKYKKWLTDDTFSAKTKAELLSIEGNEDEIKERFYKGLEFGTGGLRGIIGAGENRMNIYTVGKATQGLCDYILERSKTPKGVAISYDSRHMSYEFAVNAALTLNGNGIKTYMYSTLMPTPLLSFAVRTLNLDAGIMITASHNPKEYNGYKLYWSDGCQVPPPMDAEIIDYVNNVKDFSDIKKMELEEAKNKGLFHIIPQEVYDKYAEMALNTIRNKSLLKQADNLKVIYTPLNGTGNIPVTDCLKKAGFSHVYVVPKEQNPDPDFTTTGYPNPEDEKVFTLSKVLCDEKNGDIIIATDPDADRIGVMVKHNGKYISLTGNTMGALVLNYQIEALKEANNMPENPAVVKTIVTTNMIDRICKKDSIAVFDVLTGFKYIGKMIKQFEENGDYSYIFGMEESYGMLTHTFVRDKDAITAALAVCEVSLYYKEKGMTLIDGLNELYEQYGYFYEDVSSITLKGIDGMETMKKIMSSLRLSVLKEVNGIKTVKYFDYKAGYMEDIVTGEKTKTTLPVSDVLYYMFDDGSWFAIRPSGTEPKIKLYAGVIGNTMEKAKEKQSKIKEVFLQKAAVYYEE